jgi:hypothetical protein
VRPRMLHRLYAALVFVSKCSLVTRFPWGYTRRRFRTQEAERTMPYIVVLAITLLLIVGSVVFVRTPPRRHKPPIAK